MLIVDVIEVCGYLSVGSVKRVCVDRSVSPEFLPFVRSVSIADGSMIIVEYEDYGCEEGGVCIEFIYESIESAITAAEAYLKVGVGGLANFTKSGIYPEKPCDRDSSSDSFEESLRSGCLDLPTGWIERRMPVGYWRDMVDGIR